MKRESRQEGSIENPKKNPTKARPGMVTAPPFSTTNQPEGRGRPKGSLSITNHLKKLLSENKEKEAIELSRAIIKHAKAGKAPYASMIIDRVDGVLKQEIEFSGLDELGTRLAVAMERREKYDSE